MILNIPAPLLRTLLSFCYLLLLTAFVSCTGSAPKKASPKATASEPSNKDIENIPDTETILFFGNSLTAGMGLDPNEAFPALIQKKLDSLHLNFKTVNAGLSGETTASGKNRVDWVLNQPVSIFILELGANDGLRGIPLTETQSNLQEIIDKVRAKSPQITIILAGMQIPPNMGSEYATQFKNIFPRLAEQNDLLLIPFLLEDVAGIPDRNQADGIHPTKEGHQIIAKTIWPLIEKAINQ